MMARVLRRSRAGATSLVVALVGLSAACSSRQVPVSASGSGPETAPAVDASETPDYATQRAELIIKNQPDEPNRWTELTNELARLQGAWAYMLTTSAGAQAWQADDLRGPVSPLRVLEDPKAVALAGEVRRFIEVVDTMSVTRELERISHNGSFVAPRTVDALIDESMPEAVQSSLFAELWIMRMRLAGQAGDEARFSQSLRHMLMVARGLTGRGQLQAWNIATNIRSEAFREVRRAVIAGDMSTEAWSNVLGEIRARPDMPPIAVALECERLLACDALTRIRDKVHAEAAAAATPGPVGASPVATDEFVHVNELFSLATMATSDDSTLRTIGRDRLARAMGSEAKAGALSAASIPFPLLLRSPLAAARHSIDRNGTEAMLALEIFRGREGRYPESLTELVPLELPGVPEDPWAPGQPLLYKRLTAEGGRPETGYLLYSVGMDGVDDGGEMRAGLTPSATGGMKLKGFDHVINTSP